ncbi:MAG: endonuclease/exonuclease/phosphatase family protein [Bacteroidia bacterium]|nr:endonuclease/exonuclease/phosphatase family protein [Bacteroidia bacterium]
MESGYEYHHYGETSSYREVSHFGLITFSKFPIIAKGIIKFKDSKNNACLYSDILINQDTVRVYNIHLESIHLEHKDHSTIDNIINLSEVTQSSWYSLFNHLRTAFTKRASQADIISTHMTSCIYPIILCGDFNDTPSSYAYRQISEHLNDNFDKGNFGLGATYAGELPIRIDFILNSKGITGTKQLIIKEKFSDHYPLVCRFEYLE